MAGSRAIPISDDLYTQRVMFMIHLCGEGGEVYFDKGLFLSDPRDLVKVTEDKQEEFNKLLEVTSNA